MLKRCNTRFARPAPVQLPLFTEVASLIRVRPERNEFRYYCMVVWPELFGRALLLRQWGRIGTEGRRRLDPHPDPRRRHQRPRPPSRRQAPPRPTRTAPREQGPSTAVLPRKGVSSLGKR